MEREEALIRVLEYAVKHGADETTCARIAGTWWYDIKSDVITHCHPRMRETERTILMLSPKAAREYLKILTNK